jgi:hypothetical protein
MKEEQMPIEIISGRWYDPEEGRWRDRRERPSVSDLAVFSEMLAHLATMAGEEEGIEELTGLGRVYLQDQEPTMTADEALEMAQVVFHPEDKAD